MEEIEEVSTENLPIQTNVWERLATAGLIPPDLRFDDFVDTDSELVLRENVTEETILTNARNDVDSDESSDDDDTPERIPITLCEAARNLSEIRLFLQSRDVEASVLQNVDNIESVLLNLSAEKKQTSILDFFSSQ